jgi:flagellar biosynthetic protein FliR
MLDAIISGGIFGYLVVFARIGSMLMMLPGFGEAYVSPRIRLALALVISLVVAPAVADLIPAIPESGWTLLLMLGNEIGIGLFLGLVARLTLSALQVAGTIIAFQSSLANAFVNDPTTAQQASVPSTFLLVLGLMLIFATNLHHMMLTAMVESYGLFSPAALPEMGDMAQAITKIVSGSFVLAVQISAPFLVVGLVFYLGLGLLARLMPQVQVFFIAMPLQVLLGLVVLLLGGSTAMLWFLDRFQGVFEPLGMLQ